MLVCPACGERGIGKVGIGQYYCKDCCVEFEYKDDHFKIYNVEDDGTLSQYVEKEEAEPELQIVQKTG